MVTNERHFGPSIDYDTFVQNPVYNFRKTRRVRGLRYLGHFDPPIARFEFWPVSAFIFFGMPLMGNARFMPNGRSSL